MHSLRFRREAKDGLDGEVLVLREGRGERTQRVGGLVVPQGVVHLGGAVPQPLCPLPHILGHECVPDDGHGDPGGGGHEDREREWKGRE